MNAVTPASTLATPPLSPPSVIGCPLNHGTAVVDQLLAAITRDRADDSFEPALDAALDLRLLLSENHDPDLLLSAYFRLRSTAEERHYLACFRLRRWLETQLCALVFFDRTHAPHRVSVSLDAAGCADLRTRCAYAATAGDPLPSWIRVKFAHHTPTASLT